MKNALDFHGASVLVVGGSSGIGNAIATAFRDQGAQVCLTGTRAAASAYDGEGNDFAGMHYRQLDATDKDAVQHLQLPFSGLTVLVNSQGAAPAENVDPLDLDLFDRMLDINLRSVMHTCVRFRDNLGAARGCIISLGSVACFTAVPHRPSYSAAKGGLLTLTKSLASSWAPSRVRVNGIAPGYVATRMTLARRRDAGRYQQTLSRIPMGRWGEPAEIAGIALFLASPLAGYVTGQMISADGGIGL